MTEEEQRRIDRLERRLEALERKVERQDKQLFVVRDKSGLLEKTRAVK